MKGQAYITWKKEQLSEEVLVKCPVFPSHVWLFQYVHYLHEMRWPQQVAQNWASLNAVQSWDYYRVPWGLKRRTYLQMDQTSFLDLAEILKVYIWYRNIFQEFFPNREEYLTRSGPAVMTAVICFIIWLCPHIHTMLLTASTRCPLAICAFNSTRASCQSMLTKNHPMRRKWTNSGVRNKHLTTLKLITVHTPSLWSGTRWRH